MPNRPLESTELSRKYREQEQKHQAERQAHQARKKRRANIAAIFIAICIFASFITALEKIPPMFISSAHGQTNEVMSVLPDDHIIGSSDAAIIFIVYTDTNCPYCAGAHKAMQRIVQEYKSDDVAWVVRHMPILSPNSYQEAIAAECAAQWEKFFPYLDHVFGSRSSKEQLLGFAHELGIPATEFSNCLDLKTPEIPIREKVNADMESGYALEIHGIPSWIIIVRGKKPFTMSGAFTFEEAQQYIDRRLAEMRQ